VALEKDWFKEIVAESVRAARGPAAEDSPLLLPPESPLAGFAGRIEGRRVQPLEVIFQISREEEQDSPALRRALQHLLQHYRAAWSGRSGI
jgi:hypothetical protein